MRINPYASVWKLSVGERQRIELLKLLLADTRTLIFDEPTKVLVPHEVEGLFRIFRIFAATATRWCLSRTNCRKSCLRRPDHGHAAWTGHRNVDAIRADENTLVTLMFGSGLPNASR